MKQAEKPAQIVSCLHHFRRSGNMHRLIPLALIILVSVTASLGGLGKLLRLETILTYHTALHEFIDRYGMLSVAVFAGAYVTAIALSIPAALFFTISGGFLFGWFVGGVIGVFAKTSGSLVLFLIARYSFKAFAMRKLGHRLSAIGESFREDSFFYILFLRLQPIIPFWAVNLGAALFDVPVRRFVGATMIGIAPAAFIFATAGAGIDGLIADKKSAFEQCLQAGMGECSLSLHVSDLLTPTIIAAIAAMAVLSLVPVMVKRWRRKRNRVAG